MRKLLILIVALASIQVAFADGSANIKIRIDGSLGNNRYFLCIRNVGCLSILGAQRGKVFPVYRTVNFHTGSMYVADTGNNFHLSPQTLPSSCNKTVNPNQTITISGKIADGGNGTVHINQLQCSVS